jgi:hypothetical protein
VNRAWFAYVTVAALLAGCGSAAPVGKPAPSTTTSVPASPTPTGSTRLVYGVDVNQYDRDIGVSKVPRVLQMITDAGGRAVRIGGNWSTVEPSPGHFDWSQVDALFSLAKADRLTVLFELGDEPAWDAEGGNPAAPPADCTTANASCASVANYVEALVAHAAPEGLRYLVVRNEPQNFATNWVGGTPSSYARFQQVAYQAAHRADPTIEVLNGGTDAPSPALQAARARLGTPSLYERQAAAFAAALYTNPAWCDSLDVLDLHVGDHGPVYSPQIVSASQAALAACDGGLHRPVWVTEVGYPSIPALQDSPVYDAELGGAYRGGDSGQARYLTDTFSALARDPQVIGINWTFTIDPNLSDAVPPGTSYNQAFAAGVGEGLATATYHTKASYQAFESLASGR